LEAPGREPDVAMTVVCHCTLGWNQRTWEALLERPVRVEVKESVLRGGKRCI